MDPTEASQIITKYQDSIKDRRPDAIVQSQNELPFVKGWIKYAHFVLGEEKVKQKIMTKA
jgi:hypothetical protein